MIELEVQLPVGSRFHWGEQVPDDLFVYFPLNSAVVCRLNDATRNTFLQMRVRTIFGVHLLIFLLYLCGIRKILKFV